LITQSVTDLLEESSKLEGVFRRFVDYGKELESHYIISRYPNFYPKGPAYKYFTEDIAEKMLKLCRVNIKRSGEIFRKIEDYVEEVVNNLNPYLVILFGSFATGNINESSDVDILVVADFEEGFLDRIKKLMDMNKFRIPIEPVGYTLKELRR